MFIISFYKTDILLVELTHLNFCLDLTKFSVAHIYIFSKGDLMVDVALLGTGGMLPLPNRFLTSMYCRINGRYIMIDCGEGTQISLRMLGWSVKNLDVICFTHFHADHISGLPGILLTVANSGRTEPITLIGPRHLKTIAKNLCVIASELPFELKIIEYDTSTQNPFQSFETKDFIINIFPVEHSTNCLAYNICVPRHGKFDPDKAINLGLPKKLWSLLQNGETLEYKNKTYTPQEVMGQPRKGIKISYCTDTRPVKLLDDFVRDSDLFICEGIYGENEKITKALAKKHMIFSEAAQVAKDANVKELWLTHFSPAMPEPENFLESAKKIIDNTVVAKDRMRKTILFGD